MRRRWRWDRQEQKQISALFKGRLIITFLTTTSRAIITGHQVAALTWPTSALVEKTAAVTAAYALVHTPTLSTHCKYTKRTQLQSRTH